MLSVVNHFAVTINRPPRHNIIDSLKTPQKTFGESSTLSVPMAAVQRGNAPADTTYTKIFVGGLAWETQRDVMRRYFEQFGEILEAVVITDKNTGRSKGYGFVTFKDPNSAMRACENPTPVIDGRRANCNLAFLGASTNNRLMRPPPLPFGVTGRAQVNNAVISSAYRSPAPSTIATAYYPQPPHYALPYSVYGYSPGYPQENLYPMSYYGAGGQQQQFTPYYPAATPSVGFYNNYQPYYTNYSQSTHFHSGLNLHYPQTVQYPYLPQQFASASTTPILSLPASIAAASVSGANAGSAMAPSSSRQQVKITSNQNISS